MTFRQLIQPYCRKITFILGCILLTNLLALALPWGIKIIIDEVIVNNDVALLNYVAVVLLAVILLRSILNYGRKYSSSVLGEQLICSLRERIFQHIHRLSLEDLKNFSPSQMMSRFTGDLESLRRFLFGDAIEFIYGILSVGLIFIILVLINLKLTLISIIFLPFFAAIYVRMLPRLKDHYRIFRQVWGEVSSRLNQVLQGAATVRVFSAHAHELEILKRKHQQILKSSSKAHGLNAQLWILVELFSSLGIITVLWLGTRDVIRQQMSVGELIAFYSYLGLLFSPLIRLVVINNSYQEAVTALDRINDLFTISPSIQDVRIPVKLNKIDGDIEFNHVYFGYNKEDLVLTDIHFNVERGESIGIVGASGVGKSTLIHLLMRLYEPKEGSILIDGFDLRDLKLDDYRKKVAVVLQDDFLFNGTIKENICYGSFDATDQQIEHVARLAYVHTFIHQLPAGYETSVGERGLKLSSGQRQRIAIARALLKNPSILILDEATSAVDALTENMIQDSICEFMKHKTIITIAHRFSTILQADRIIVLDKGRIAEIGSHNYLLKRQGIYSNLYFEQFKKSDLNPLAEI